MKRRAPRCHSSSRPPPRAQLFNSSFNETPGSRKRDGRTVADDPSEDAAGLGIADGAMILIGNHRGEVELKAKFFEG